MGRISVVAAYDRPVISENRRTHRRRKLSHPIRLEIELHGYDSEERRFEVSGETMNLSRSGMLARLERTVPRESRCVIYFPTGHGVVGRTMVYGRVRRVGESESGCAVAVQFDVPLESLEAL